MRLGAYRIGSFAPAQPESNLDFTDAAFDALVTFHESNGFSEAQAHVLIAKPGIYEDPLTDTDGEGTSFDYSETYPGLNQGSGTIGRVRRRSSTQAVNYRLHLSLYGQLSYWMQGAQWEQTLNEPDTLNFSYPADATWAQHLHRPNRVVLCDDSGYAIQKFWIEGAIPPKKRTGGEIRVEVTAHSALGELAYSWVTKYPLAPALLTEAIDATTTTFEVAPYADVPESGTLLVDSERMTFTHVAGVMTVVRGADSTDAAEHANGSTVHIGRTYKAHITALLSDYQDPVVVSPWSVKADVDTSLVFLEFRKQSILDCIKDMHQLTGFSGQFTVLPTGQFVWTDTLGSTGDITLGSTLTDLEITPEEDDLCTRLYLYGGGESDDTRVELPSPGYVEANTGTYGIIPKSIVIENVYDPVTLLAIAEALIPILSEPQFTYRASGVDDKAYAGTARLAIGSAVDIDDTEMDIATTETAVRITRPLDSIKVDYEFARKSRDIKSLVEQINRRLVAQEAKRTQVVLQPMLWADTAAELPDRPPIWFFGRANDTGEIYKRNAAGDGWEPVNAWREYTGP